MAINNKWVERQIGDDCFVGDGAHAKIPRQNTGIMYLTSKNFKSGVAPGFVSLEMIKSLPLWYPLLPTQHKIAAILSAYDDLIENNTRRIKILEEMAQALYREWELIAAQLNIAGNDFAPEQVVTTRRKLLKRAQTDFQRTLLERLLALKHLSRSIIYSSSSLNIHFLVHPSK